MKKSSRKHVALLIGMFLVILMGCAKPPATPTQGGVVISTFTAAPAKSPVPPAAVTSTLAATANSEVVGQLPGLSPVNVTVGLEEQKFTCTAIKKVASQHQRTCLKGLPAETLFEVVIFGREPFVVDFIEATVKQAKNPDSKIAAEFLSLIASLPYDGSTPDEARAWIGSSIPALSSQPGEAQKATLAGVTYVLSGTPAAITLKMGETP